MLNSWCDVQLEGVVCGVLGDSERRDVDHASVVVDVVLNLRRDLLHSGDRKGCDGLK